MWLGIWEVDYISILLTSYRSSQGGDIPWPHPSKCSQYLYQCVIFNILYIFGTYITNSIEQSWEDSSLYSAGEEVLHLLWNLKVHYHACRSLPFIPIPELMHPVCTFPSCFPKIHSNIFPYWHIFKETNFQNRDMCHIFFNICPQNGPP